MAVSIAKAAYQKAAKLTGFTSDFVGIGATCALASVPIKRGEHRAFIACHGSFGTRTVNLTLAKVRAISFLTIQYDFGTLSIWLS